MSDLAVMTHNLGRSFGSVSKLCSALMLVGSFLSVSIIQAQSVDSVACGNPALREELVEMGKLDQEVRKFMWGGRGQLPDSSTLARMVSVDSVNTECLKKIIERYGWPGFSLVGKDGGEAVFLIVQHTADWDFQKRVLPLLREACERKEADGQSLALMTDRIRVHEGKPQLYGSHFDIRDGQVVFREIEDSSHVDERRAKMGLLPLQAYKEFVEEASGLKNHGLTGKQAEEKQ